MIEREQAPLVGYEYLPARVMVDGRVSHELTAFESYLIKTLVHICDELTKLREECRALRSLT